MGLSPVSISTGKEEAQAHWGGEGTPCGGKDRLLGCVPTPRSTRVAGSGQELGERLGTDSFQSLLKEPTLWRSVFQTFCLHNSE